MSNELIVSSRTSVSPTPRELAATLFRRPRLVAAAFGAVLAATMLVVVFSARYESHFKVLLRRGRYDPVVSSQPPSPMDFTRPDITEEELNSEVELLRDEDLLKKVVAMAELVPADTPDSERAEEVEHAVRKLSRRLDVEALKKSNLIQVRYKDTSPEKAARVLSALSTVYVQRHTIRDCINPKPNWCASLALGAWLRRRWNATSRCRSWAKRKLPTGRSTRIASRPSGGWHPCKNSSSRFPRVR